MSEGSHEKSDFNPKYVLYFALALVIATAAAFAGVRWMFFRFEVEQARRENQPPMVIVAPVVPEPKLQVSPQGDLQELLLQENKILSTYKWIDRDQGVARIPIDRAMQLFIERQKK